MTAAIARPALPVKIFAKIVIIISLKIPPKEGRQSLVTTHLRLFRCIAGE